MKVVQIQRRPNSSQFSMEGYFRRVRAELADRIDLQEYVLPCLSRGVLRRIWNCLAAWWHQREVNHITGDIHYAGLLLPRRRTILTIHDCQILQRLKGWRRAIVKCLWFDLPVRHACRITVVSEETKRQLLLEVAVDPDKVRVIPVSVAELLKPSPKAFDQACPRILQIGTKSNKNVERLVLALKGIHCKLDIVGPVNEPLRRLLLECGTAFQTFERLSDEQMFERYRAADIVSFVSTSEGFGMPIVESQWVERVCITSNCSSMPEVAGPGACLIDPYDVNAIRAGFVRLIQDSEYRESVIEAGRRNRVRFHSGQIALDYLDIYHEVFERLK